jgi:hypothetical protein
MFAAVGCGGGLGDDSTPLGLPGSSNTVEIFLREDEPVKLFLVAETVVIGGNEPVIEIAGRSDPTTGAKGSLNICNLILREVEADRLDVKETEVVRMDTVNVVAHDNEFDVEVEPANVVRCGRGGTTVLTVGIDRRDLDIGNLGDDAKSTLEALFEVLGKERDSGARVDRIRVIGPEGKTGFIENLVILRSSAFGKIQVRDVKIQNLVLDTVSLDDVNDLPSVP